MADKPKKDKELIITLEDLLEQEFQQDFRLEDLHDEFDADIEVAASEMSSYPYDGNIVGQDGYDGYNKDKHYDVDDYFTLKHESSEPSNKKNEWYNQFMKLYVKDLESLVKRAKTKISTYHVVSGSGEAWYLEPLSKTFVKIQRGSEIIIIPGKTDERGRLLVRTMNSFLLIPEDEILNVGYN